MSIKNNDKETNSAPVPQAGKDTRKAKVTPEEGHKPRFTRSTSTSGKGKSAATNDRISEIMGSNINFAGTNVGVNSKAVELLNEMADAATKAGNNKFNVRFIEHDDDVLCAPLIIAYNTKGEQCFFTYIIESDLRTGKFKDKLSVVDGIQVQLFDDTSSAWDGVMHASAKAEVDRTVGKADYRYSGFSVIKDWNDLTDKADLAIIFSTAESNLRSQQSGEILTASAIAQSGYELSATHVISPDSTVMDLEGNYNASDVESTLELSLINDGREKHQSKNVRNISRRLSKLSSYLDLIYNPDSWESITNPVTRQNEQVSKGYHPMIVMSSADGVSPEATQGDESYETFLCNLLLAGQLATGENYRGIVRQYDPKNSPSIGVLSYEHEAESCEPQFQAAKIIKGNSGKDADAIPEEVYMERMFRKDMTVCLDVLRGGRSSWVYEAAVASVIGSETVPNGAEYSDRDAAEIELREMFDAFTDGHFTELQGNSPIFEDGSVIVNAGVFGSDEKSQKDIRSFNTRYLVDYFGEDASTRMEEYYNSMVPGGTDGAYGEMALSNRAKTLAHATGVKYTGLYDRLMFNEFTLDNFVVACDMCGLRVISEGLSAHKETTRGATGFRAGRAVSKTHVFGERMQGRRNDANSHRQHTLQRFNR